MSSESGERWPARVRGMKARPLAETENLPCPRCDSTNTKFCYYNNYNLCQPRHFCKSCHRYWTRGGTLRNVPVGGSTRKLSSNKRSRTVAAAAASPAISPKNSGPAPVPLVLEMGTGSGCEVNLNEAVPKPETRSLTLLSTPVGGGGVEFVPLGGYELGLEQSGLHGFEYGLGLCDWPIEAVGAGNGGEATSGNVSGGVAATSWNAWQMGGGLAEGGLPDGGDCFVWPELTIPASGRRS